MQERQELVTDLPSYSYDDFMVGTTPYEYVFRFADNDFTHRRMIDRMSKNAKLVGVSNFGALYKEYIKSVSIKAARPVGNISDFSGQKLSLATGKWIADDYRIVTFTNTGDLVACTHPIMPIERIVNVDTGLEKLNLAFKRGGKWRKDLIVDKSVLASPQKILDLASSGISVTSENAKFLIAYLQDVESLNYEEIPEKKSAARLGWIDGYGFAPYEDTLIFDGDDNFRNLFNSVKQFGDFNKWVSIASEMRRKDVSCRIALASSFASALVKWCDISSFFVHIWTNETSSGKTVMLMVASSVWGDPGFGAYTQSFNATTVSMELTADFFNSMPLVLDELQLAKDTHGNIRFNVYNLAQGLGKGRGRKSGGIQRTPSWNLCIMTSGETPITNISDGAGSYARVIEIELDRVVIDAECGNRIVSTIKMNYGHAGKRFIQVMNEIGKEKIKAMFVEKLQKVIELPDVQEKQAGAAALLLLADDLVSEHILQDDSGLTLQELLPFLLSKKQTSINERAYEIAIEWIAANANRFESNVSENATWRAENQGVQYGVKDENTVYIINSQFNKLMEDNGFNMRSVLSSFRKQGLIETYTNSGKTRNTVRKSINRTMIQCVGLKINVEDGYCATDPKSPFDL